MAKFCDMLLYFRKKAGLSQQELSDSLGMKRSTVGMYETGKREPDFETLEVFADFFNVSMDVMTGRGGEDGPKGERIPVVGSVPAGIPVEAIEDIVDWEEIPASMCSGGREYFGLLVKGDSMYPEYMEGDTIIVRKTPSFESGDVCVVYVNGYDATLKRVKVDEAGAWTLIPRNPEYPPKTFSAKEIQTVPVSVAGVVVELRRKMK